MAANEKVKLSFGGNFRLGVMLKIKLRQDAVVPVDLTKSIVLQQQKLNSFDFIV